MHTVTVIGGGAWGVALAAAAARAESDVVLHSRRDLRESVPRGVRVVKDLESAARHARLIVLAVPSAACRALARTLGDFVDGSHYVVHGVRGLEGETLTTVSDVIREETPVKRVGALGGPALANDLADGQPSVIVVGSVFPEVNQALIQAFGSPKLRVYPTHDIRGLEWASALVGCLTIAVGYVRALGTSPGLVAALITSAIGEASRIAAAAGGDEATLLGLAGYGDLLASIAQSERPEVIVGSALAKGFSAHDAARTAQLSTESLALTPRLARWAEERGVRAPIVRALANAISGDREPDAILHELMSLPIEDQVRC